MFWYILGGPVANALVVVVAGLLYTQSGGLPTFNPIGAPMWLLVEWAWSVLSFCLFWIAVLLLLGSLYPSGWVSTDGNKLWRLLRGGTVLDRFKAQVQIGTAVLQGIRPRDWNPAWIHSLTALNDDSADTVNSALLIYRWFLDRGDVPQAETYLTTAVKLRKKVNPADRANIWRKPPISEYALSHQCAARRAVDQETWHRAETCATYPPLTDGLCRELSSTPARRDPSGRPASHPSTRPSQRQRRSFDHGARSIPRHG